MYRVLALIKPKRFPASAPAFKAQSPTATRRRSHHLPATIIALDEDEIALIQRAIVDFDTASTQSGQIMQQASLRFTQI